MVSEYTVKPEESGVWEAHRQYIDIQYILKGEEKIGYGHIDSFKTVNEYDIDKDVTILSGNGDFFHLNKGFFAIFFPEDVHMPCIVSNIEVQDVRKVIFKVKV
jgi:YhcH/YjgK/YiaL family protein